MTTMEGSVTDLTQQLSSGEVGLVKQDSATNAISVASDKAGKSVDYTGAEGARTLSGVAAGEVSEQSTEAVNGSQLFATESRVTKAEGDIVQNTSDIADSKTAIAGLDGRVGTAEVNIAQNASDIANNTTAISSIDGRVTSVEGSVTDLTQQLTSGEVGLVKQDSATSAITVASDKAGKSVDFTGAEGARTLRGVAAGEVSAQSTEAVNGSQLFATNARVTNAESSIVQNTADIATVQNQLSDGSIGLVQQDAATRNINVAKDADGTVVNMAGTAGDRTVTGVANGAVNAASVDAINGSQLYATASSTAAGLGGDAKVNADGTISAPSYSVGGTTVHNVGDAVSNLDGRVTQNTSDITKMQNQIGDVGTQLSGAVQYDRNNDGSVNFGSVKLGGSQSAGPVVLSNVANGTSQYDAVNFGQLSELQSQVSDLNTQVGNIAPASPYFSANGSPATSGAVTNAASAGEGVGSTAAGVGAIASANGATAIGAGAQATNANSVALGQGSVTDRDNSVSVGSSSQQRQITNVAAGTADTDAVNVGQLNTSVSQGVQQAKSYTDQRFNDTNRAINSVAKSAYAGIAAAMAMPNMTAVRPWPYDRLSRRRQLQGRQRTGSRCDVSVAQQQLARQCCGIGDEYGRGRSPCPGRLRVLIPGNATGELDEGVLHGRARRA
jgi:autotransporter adhesin